MFNDIKNFSLEEWQFLISNPAEMSKIEQKIAIEELERAKENIPFTPEAEQLLFILQLGKLLYEKAQLGHGDGKDGIKEEQTEMYYKAMISLREIMNRIAFTYVQYNKIMLEQGKEPIYDYAEKSLLTLEESELK